MAKRLEPNAAAVPMAISVNMSRSRVTMDCQPARRRASPPQSTTGVASRSLQRGRRRATAAAAPATISPIAKTQHGNGQDEAHPEPARHVDESGSAPRRGSAGLGLERHAALRAGAGPTGDGCIGHCRSRRRMAVAGAVAGAGATNRAGSAMNLARELGLQNQYVVPACSALPPFATQGRCPCRTPDRSCRRRPVCFRFASLSVQGVPAVAAHQWGASALEIIAPTAENDDKGLSDSLVFLGLYAQCTESTAPRAALGRVLCSPTSSHRSSLGSFAEECAGVRAVSSARSVGVLYFEQSS